MAHYSKTYWSDDPALAAQIVATLRDSGRIEQPRLVDPHYTHTVSGGVWIDTIPTEGLRGFEGQIVYPPVAPTNVVVFRLDDFRSLKAVQKTDDTTPSVL